MNTSRPITPLIQNITHIVALNDREIQTIISVAEEKIFKRKEFILRAGDICRHETFVTKGCLKIFYTDPEGVEHNVKFAIENWWALDLESFAMQTPAFYSIQAIEDTECFQIGKGDHDSLYEAIPKLEKFARLRYQTAYLALQHRMTQNLFATAEERFDSFTKKYPGLELRIPQKDIASYVGITPEFLSMMRKRRMKTIS
jgi:CRP-like cAMP-binding protein